MSNRHIHEETTRRPIVWIAEIVAIGMIALGLVHAAPWYFFLPVVFTLAMCTWLLVSPRVSGSRVTAQAVRIHTRGNATHYPLVDIQEYRIVRWSDSSPTFHLCMKNGVEILLPTYCVGPVDAFAKALEEYGIKAKV